MFYKLIMSDEVVDETITITTEADDVFDAIDRVTKILVHPSATKLIEAIPMDDDL